MIGAALLAAALARPARAQDLGGHDLPPSAAEQAAALTPDERRATLEEMWQRRILPPDQDGWSPADMALLEKIRRNEDAALGYLRASFGGYRPWVARARADAPAAVRLTKEGYEKYSFLLTQDAIVYFERKGAETKDVFKITDWDGRPAFDADGRLTEDGARLYYRARAKLEAFWRGPDGRAYGTRRPPSAPAVAPSPAPAPTTNTP